MIFNIIGILLTINIQESHFTEVLHSLSSRGHILTHQSEIPLSAVLYAEREACVSNYSHSRRHPVKFSSVAFERNINIP